MSQDIKAAVFRIDRFVVPTESKTKFMDRVKRIQNDLNGVPGNLQNLVLTKINSSDQMDLITIVEWENAEVMSAAAATIKAKYAEENFDPKTFMRTLGVRPDFGFFSKA